ncbi:response regulator [Dyadobacter sp. MSC1_007]|jgi:two-component system invasion response regulator UvrY|uniref:response regulator n=1 Tax=Dyadobacter sp. MSC1_007 TaxID=2909264 RepID=UPI002030BB06|nr:response regulator transcription factor [Dyadobacter sp. MSC1_007]
MKVLIIDDHFLVRNSLKFMLENAYSNVVCIEADNYYNARPHFIDPEIQLIILDIDIPGGTGTGMVTEIRSQNDDVRILICSAADEELLAMDYVMAGADGYVPKSADEQEAMNAVSMVLKGKRYVSPAIQTRLLDMFSAKSRQRPRTTTRLSTREKQVLDLLLEGKWIKEIAAALNLRANTVSSFKTRIFTKLGVTNLFELAKKANEQKRYY